MSAAAAATANVAEIAAKNCEMQPIPQQPQAKVLQQAAGMLNKLGLNQCRTSSTSTPMTIGYDHTGESGMFSDSNNDTAVTGTAKATYSAGCQNVQVLAQAYNKAIQDVKCIINSTSQMSKVYVAENATISLNFGTGSHVTFSCAGGLNITNTITGSVNIYNKIDDQVKTQITNSITNHIQNAINQIQSGTGTTGPQGQGAQSFNSVISQLTSQSLAQQVSTAIDDACSEIKEGTNIDLNFLGWAYFDTPQECNISNTIHSDIIATNAVQTGFSAAFNNQNVPALLPPPPGNNPNFNPPGKGSNSTLYIILGVIAVLLLMGGGYYFYFVRNKTKKAATTKAFQYI